MLGSLLVMTVSVPATVVSGCLAFGAHTSVAWAAAFSLGLTGGLISLASSLCWLSAVTYSSRMEIEEWHRPRLQACSGCASKQLEIDELVQTVLEFPKEGGAP